jgi:signal recognition particle subunit SRP54
VRERALGEDVRKSLTPGQQVVKIVHEELTELLGSSTPASRSRSGRRRRSSSRACRARARRPPPASSRSCSRKEGKKPALVAADLQRPAAIDQLVQLGAESASRSTPTSAPTRSRPSATASSAQADGRDVVILDTAGRLHVDEALMDELAAVRARRSRRTSCSSSTR